MSQLKGEDINPVTLRPYAHDGVQVYISDEAFKDHCVTFAGISSAKPDIGHLSSRLPDDQIGPTPAADERRFLAVTQRKVEEIEAQIEKLFNECQQYPGIDQRHMSIFRTHCEIGLAFAAKALMYVEIVDDGK